MSTNDTLRGLLRACRTDLRDWIESYEEAFHDPSIALIERIDAALAEPVMQPVPAGYLRHEEIRGWVFTRAKAKGSEAVFFSNPSYRAIAEPVSGGAVEKPKPLYFGREHDRERLWWLLNDISLSVVMGTKVDRVFLGRINEAVAALAEKPREPNEPKVFFLDSSGDVFEDPGQNNPIIPGRQFVYLSDYRAAVAALNGGAVAGPVCKGTNCSAVRGAGHSRECIAEHDGNASTDPLDTAGNRHPDYRYAGYKGLPLPSRATDDQRAAYQQGRDACTCKGGE